MIAEFIDPAILGFILSWSNAFCNLCWISNFIYINFLGFVFGYLGFGKLVFI